MTRSTRVCARVCARVFVRPLPMRAVALRQHRHPSADATVDSLSARVPASASLSSVTKLNFGTDSGGGGGGAAAAAAADRLLHVAGQRDARARATRRLKPGRLCDAQRSARVHAVRRPTRRRRRRAHTGCLSATLAAPEQPPRDARRPRSVPAAVDRTVNREYRRSSATPHQRQRTSRARFRRRSLAARVLCVTTERETRRAKRANLASRGDFGVTTRASRGDFGGTTPRGDFGGAMPRGDFGGATPRGDFGGAMPRGDFGGSR